MTARSARMRGAVVEKGARRAALVAAIRTHGRPSPCCRTLTTTYKTRDYWGGGVDENGKITPAFGAWSTYTDTIPVGFVPVGGTGGWADPLFKSHIPVTKEIPLMYYLALVLSFVHLCQPLCGR